MRANKNAGSQVEVLTQSDRLECLETRFVALLPAMMRDVELGNPLSLEARALVREMTLLVEANPTLLA